MDRGAWRATVHGVAKSQTGLSKLTQHNNKGESEQCRVPEICPQALPWDMLIH